MGGGDILAVKRLGIPAEDRAQAPAAAAGQLGDSALERRLPGLEHHDLLAGALDVRQEGRADEQALPLRRPEGRDPLEHELAIDVVGILEEGIESALDRTAEVDDRALVFFGRLGNQNRHDLFRSHRDDRS